MSYEESQFVELKRELNDKLEKEAVAFLNNREGGTVYIGIDDDGEVVGVEDVDAVQLQVAMRLRDNVMPSSLGLFDIFLVIV